MNQVLWQTVLGEIEVSVSKAAFAAWFKETELNNDSTDEELIIGVKNIFTKQQLETKFDGQIRQILAKNSVHPRSIVYKINSDKKPSRSHDPVVNDFRSAKSITTNTQEQAENKFNPKYTLDSFVVGSNNDLAYTVAQAIVEKPGERYNPMFVYGSVGLGKTHLIQAIGSELQKQKPELNVHYTTTEAFIGKFMSYLRSKNKRDNFSDRYKNIDVLIMDDIQFIAGKETTEEAFFHIFNYLHQNNKQILISSDKPPKRISSLTDRLRSRLEWGMAIDIHMPDFETRCAILQSKALQAGFELEPDTIEFIASNIKTNVRELEGALNQLLAFCEMRGISPDKQIAEGIIGNVSRARPKHLTPKQIVSKVAYHFNVDVNDILSPKRDRNIMIPRQIAMYLMRSELHTSFPSIARELGRKDHTTAIHSVEKITKAIKLDYTIRENVADIREKLYV
ncbi:MAG: chromosomal replication initiator protein DnaA [Candidatus Saccharibacteria bacterium]|nr:chromosomal replication initiator protein DnaA [Candidatus Saccharibacteria bacterium]